MRKRKHPKPKRISTFALLLGAEAKRRNLASQSTNTEE